MPEYQSVASHEQDGWHEDATRQGDGDDTNVVGAETSPNASSAFICQHGEECNKAIQNSRIVCSERPHKGSEDGLTLSRKQKSLRRFIPSWHDSWTPEILGCIIALASLLAIVLLLVLHRDKPLPDWPKLITINSMLAVFSTLLKIGLAIPLSQGISQMKWQWFNKPRDLADIEHLDGASRGPMGSMLLLFKGRWHPLVYFGAVLTLLALATEPFIQQLVHYDSCSRPSTSSAATVARSNSYVKLGPRKADRVWEVSKAMAIAINTGGINPANDPAAYVPFQCETGNCTFSSSTTTARDQPTYMSLGFCSSCEDISTNIVNRNSTLFAFLPASGSGTTNLTVRNADSNQNLLATAWDSGAPGTLRSLHSDFLNASSPASAFSCKFYSCVKTFSGSVVNGTLTERVLATQPLTDTQPTPDFNEEGQGEMLALNNTITDGHPRTCESSTSNRTDYVPVSRHNIEGGPANDTTQVWYPIDCVWSMSYFSLRSLNLYMKELFNLQNVSSLDPDGGKSGPLLLRGLQSDGANLSFVSQYAKNLTDAMTAVVRAEGGDNLPYKTLDYARGTAHGLSTCAHVEWSWLALPAALVLGVTMFLLILIVSRRQRAVGEPLWKSSAIALLYTRLGIEDGRVGQRQLPGKAELTNLGEHTRVRLINDEGKPLLLQSA